VPDGSSVVPFDRVYSPLSAAIPAERLYQAFARAGQGTDQLPSSFSNWYVRGVLTVAGLWCHSHGLHVVPHTSETTEELLSGYASNWFTLSWYAETEAQMLSYLYRGFAALQTAVDSVLGPATNSSGVVDLAGVSPRLARTLDLLAICVAFEAEPGWILDQLLLTFDHRPATPLDRSPAAALPALIAEELDLALIRMEEVEGPDRRLLLRAAGREETE
jgi:hypothetical protein